MKRTTVFGGSFNPIHIGHINLSRQLLKEGLTDEVWLLISPQNPLKKQASLIDEQTRLHLAQLALEDEEGITPSDFEFTLPRPSYTWNTLNALEKTYPDRLFSLLIGADNWAIFNRWAHYEDILRHYPIFVYPRIGCKINVHALPESVKMVQAPTFPYSSTEIRQAIARGSAFKDMLPPKVYQQIQELKLYRT